MTTITNGLDWMGLESPGDFEASAFSLESVNARLARGMPVDPAGPPVITIIPPYR